MAALSLVSAHSFHALALLSGLNGIAFAFATPALQALPPRIVDEALLARTNAMVALTDQLAIVLGPVAAGVAIAAFGFRGAFVFDALTYAAGIAVLPLVRVRPVRSAPGTGPVEGDATTVRFRDTFEGWKLVARERRPAPHRGLHPRRPPPLRRRACCPSRCTSVTCCTASPRTFAALQTAFGIFLVLGGVVAARVGDRVATFGWVAVGVLASGGDRRGLPRHPLAAGGLPGRDAVGPGHRACWPARRAPSCSARAPSTRTAACWPRTSWPAAAASCVGLGVASVLVSNVGVQWSALGLGVGVSLIAVALLASDAASP